MSKETLYIPKKINVGFQLREGTYTGKLAYIIYWDDKGKLRKEASWESWRHKPGEPKNRWARTNKDREEVYGDDVAPQVFDNVPTEGFVLNKGVGGQRESWGWNARNEYIRVYDPRGFEFEISVANLLYILQECTSTKGKGLEGEFVYSWNGTELVLLPVDTYEYKQSSGYTDLQSQKVTKDDIIEGGTYLSKNRNTLIYIGRFDWHEQDYDSRNQYGYKYVIKTKKRHVFYDVESKRFEKHDGYVKLGSIISKECVSNYAELTDNFLKSQNASLVDFIKLSSDKIEFEKRYNRDYEEPIYGNYGYINDDGEVIEVSISTNTKYDRDKEEYKGFNITKKYILSIKDGALNRSNLDSRHYYHNEKNPNTIYNNISKEELEKMNIREIIIVTKNGGEIKSSNYGLNLYNY